MLGFVMNNMLPSSTILLKTLLFQPRQFKRNIQSAGIADPTQGYTDLFREGGIKRRYLYHMFGSLALYLVVACVTAPIVGMLLAVLRNSITMLDTVFNATFGVWIAAIAAIIAPLASAPGFLVSATGIVVFGAYLVIFWGVGFYFVFTYPHSIILYITIFAGPLLSIIMAIVIERRINKGV